MLKDIDKYKKTDIHKDIIDIQRNDDNVDEYIDNCYVTKENIKATDTEQNNTLINIIIVVGIVFWIIKKIIEFILSIPIPDVL